MRGEQEKITNSKKSAFEVENLQVEILPVENRLQLSTDISSKDVLSKDELSKDYKREFEDLWSLYPNKKGKMNAMNDYIKARKSGTVFEAVKEGIMNYIQYINIEKIPFQYIKHGSTWFHQRCWEDDYTIRRKPTTNDLAFDFTEGL